MADPAVDQNFGAVEDNSQPASTNPADNFGAVEDQSFKAEPDTSAMKDYVDKNLAAYQASAEYKIKNPEQHPAKTYWDSMKAGFQGSSLGLAWRDKMPDTALPPDADMGMRIANQIGQLTGDIPAMVAGGSFFGGVGAGVGAAEGSVVPVAGTVAGGISGAAVGTMSGAFAVPQALRKMLIDHYERGDITDPGEFAHRLMATSWEAIKGGVTGAATAATGGLAAPIAGPVGQFGAELAIMTTVGKALEGKLPSAQDFVDGALTLGVVHGITSGMSGGLDHVETKMRNIYAATGETPAEVVEAATKDPVLRQNLLSTDLSTPEQARPTELQHSPDSEEKDADGKPLPNAPEDQWKLVGRQPPEPPSGGSGEPPREDFEKRILDTIVNRPENEDTTPFQQKLKEGVDSLNVAVRDNLSPIENLVDASTDSGHLEPSKNPYMLARLYRDVNGKILTTYADHTFDFNDWNKNTGEGLAPILRDVPNKDIVMLDAFLKANRVLADKSQREQGISVEDAQKLVDKNKAEFQPIADRLYDFQDRMKQYAVDSGILSEKTSDVFDKASLNYAPLYKLLDVDPLTDERAGGKSLFQKMFGSERKSISSIQGIYENTAAILKAAEKNRIMTALTELPELQENGLARKIDPEDTKMGNGKNVITVKVDGQPERWAFEQPVADAIKAMDYSPQFTSLWAKMFSKTFNLAAAGLRFGVTGLPDFALRHGYRALVASDIQTKYPGVPFMGVLDSIGEQFGHSEDFWKFVSAGGGNTGFEKVNEYLKGDNWGEDAKTLLQQAKEFTWPDTSDPFLKKAWNAIWTPARASEVLTQVLDNAPRFREFKRAGGTDGDLNTQVQAAFDARNVSVDYQRYGALTKMVSFAQPFLNVDMQGTFRALEGLKDPKVLAKALALVTLPEIVNFMMNKDDERYKNAPLWEHGAFMDIPINWWKSAKPEEAMASLPSLRRQLPDGSWEVNTGPMIRIPRAFTLGMLYGSIPHMILSKYYDHNPRAFDNLGEQVAKVLMPMGATTLLQPALEQATNHSMFTGKALVPDYLEKQLPQYQFEPYTSEVAKQVGKLIGYLPKVGMKGESPASPIVIDNYIRSWGGTLGGYVVNLLDKGLHEVGVGSEKEGPETKWTEMPEVKQFFSHYMSTHAQSIEDFRNNFADISAQQQTLKATAMRVHQGDNSAKGDYVDLAQKFNPGLAEQMEAVNGAIKKQGLALSLVQRRNDMTPADKRQTIDTILGQMMGMAEQANKMYYQAKGK